ncbi:MAG: amidohydrolase family protein [Candidatus Thorarchaeota archaeon]
MTIEDDLKKTKGFDTIHFKYTGPKWDAHTHLYKIEDIREFVKYASDYNIQKFTAIVREDWRIFEENFPGKFVFARFLNSQNLFGNNIQTVLEDVQDMFDSGYSIVKFWYAPRWRDYVQEQFKASVEGFRIDDPKFDPIYSKIADLGLILLIHVSDPDILYQTKYQPASFYGTKQQHLKELENIISKHSNLKIQVAHMAGQPEHLDQLGKWFDEYSNFSVDISSAKWMAREFSYNPEKVAEFFNHYQDRILFGTDIVTGRTDREPIPGYYYIRYLSFQALLETNVQDLPLPIADPDNDNKTVINGLDLPQKILRKIYWDNSEKFYSK